MDLSVDEPAQCEQISASSDQTEFHPLAPADSRHPTNGVSIRWVASVNTPASTLSPCIYLLPFQPPRWPYLNERVDQSSNIEWPKLSGNRVLSPLVFQQDLSLLKI